MTIAQSAPRSSAAPSGDSLAAGLLFAFDENADVDRERALTRHRTRGAEQRQEVALVVRGSARVDATIADLRLERRLVHAAGSPMPLHVVVAVDQHGRRLEAEARQLADGKRIATETFVRCGLAAGRTHQLADLLGGATQVRRVCPRRSRSRGFAASPAGSRAAPRPCRGTLLAPSRGSPPRYVHWPSVSAGPSLYRRHRPRSFADVVGQEHVVRTLRNAIEQGKVHHAYLFVGSRGTGKTSMAKILAACLNCERGPTVEPCGTCEPCVAIQTATSLDVIEMDAASNNSVDDIRDLRESVAFAPVSGRSKVYILDEAHMLSPQAWNAFLKTLEEPPPNTIFVLATTEAGKVLPTVVDRCHRFDFARPTVEQLSRVLRRVAEQESISIAPDALALLARHATGSFRDALGTLEQLVTYTGSDIAAADVLAVLGAADEDVLFGALDAVATHDAAAALDAAARFAATGRDLAIAARDLEVHARELLVVRTLGRVPDELRVTPERDERLAEQAQRVPAGDLVRLLDLLASALRAIKDGADPRTHLELALVKTATPEVDASTKALLARIARLESAGVPDRDAPPVLGGGAPPPAAEPQPAVVHEAPSAPEPAAAAGFPVVSRGRPRTSSLRGRRTRIRRPSRQRAQEPSAAAPGRPPSRTAPAALPQHSRSRSSSMSGPRSSRRRAPTPRCSAQR